MIKKLKEKTSSILKRIKLKPVTVASKCRLQFGGAVILVISLALLIPHYWMGKLIDNSGLDLGRTILYLVKNDHFSLDNTAGKGVLRLKSEDENIDNLPVRWITINKDGGNNFKDLSLEDAQIAQKLLQDEQDNQQNQDFYWFSKNSNGVSQINYMTIVKAKDICSDSKYLKGLTPGYSPNEPVGIMIVKLPALQISKTRLYNNLVIIVAGLLAATGALIAFYVIAQRIILRPIRQLRALVNNVAEGNLDARSSIKTQDEYQKLADAFNSMLDGLQKSQQKLRQSNRQLDDKIAELSDRNIELYRASKLQSEFLANISHEFRTPLNAILGFAELLKNKSTDGKSKRYADNIITSGRNLMTMISDLLELAKIEAGKMEIRSENTSIPDMCRGLVTFFTPLMEQKKLQISFSLEDDIPIVYTDPMKVQQILYNFISNAIKFTPENGQVKIIAKMSTENTIRIEVCDSGPGIEEKYHSEIFEKFRQTDNPLTKEVSGTGLGLAISREMAMLLAGAVGVISQKDKGAVFWLEIPVRNKPYIQNSQQNTP